MKALELAELFEMESDTESVYRQAAAELRRLAEVNAELLDALQLATSLAMVKFGNLDKDANLIFAQNLELIAKAKAQP